MVDIADNIFKKCENIPLTFFEFTTLMALQHFVNNKVQFAIMETGLGGRLDATNVINPEVAIITSIDFDHMEYLGNSLKEIALEKAGVFKKDSNIVMAQTASNDILKQQANKIGAKKIYELGNNFNYSINQDSSFNFSINNDSTHKNLNKKLLGEHQYINTSLALMTLNLLGIKGTSVSISEALNSVSWPGRLEPINIKGKRAYIDVSHNLEGIQKTIEFLKTAHKSEPIYTACGFMKDKDYSKMIDMLSKISKKVFLIPTSVPGRELGRNEYKTLLLDRQNEDILICNNFNDAVAKIIKENGVLLFTGSIYNYEHLYRTIQEVG
jgi:dihydrofolate synthase / folylpolyglutamate synthase